MHFTNLLRASLALAPVISAVPLAGKPVTLMPRTNMWERIHAAENSRSPLPPGEPEESEADTSASWMARPEPLEELSIPPADVAIEEVDAAIPVMTEGWLNGLKLSLYRTSISIYLWQGDLERGRIHLGSVPPIVEEAIEFYKQQLEIALKYIHTHENQDKNWPATVDRILDNPDFKGNKELEETYRRIFGKYESWFSTRYGVDLTDLYKYWVKADERSSQVQADAVVQLQHEQSKTNENFGNGAANLMEGSKTAEAQEEAIAQLEKELPRIDGQLEKGAAKLVEDIAEHL